MTRFVAKAVGAALLLVLSFDSARAAEGTFHYQAGLSEVYSQDVFRDNTNQDDFIADLSATADLGVKTPRSTTTFSYNPEYLHYAQFTVLNHFDQRYYGLWELHPGARSSFTLRQGYSNTTRREGFQDLTGIGGSGSEPVTSFTRLLAWDLEPHWSLATGPGSSVSAGALYRANRYSSETLINSDHFGVNWAMDGPAGRYQRLGGQVRLDAFQYWLGVGTLGPVYDRFVNGQATWSLKEAERASLVVAVGVYRGMGQGLAPITGPTFDLSGDWRWRRSTLYATCGSGYSTGGGISTTDRSQQAAINWATTWGRGYQLSLSASYIRRQPIGDTTGSTVPLYGRSLASSFSRTWHSGVGVRLGVAALRQNETSGSSLSYGEATLGLTYAPPVPVPKPVPEA